MTTYIVSHYWQNPKHNTTHKFDNLEEAQEEFLKMSSEDEHPGESTLEIEGDSKSYKSRPWNRQRATVTSGKFAKQK